VTAHVIPSISDPAKVERPKMLKNMVRPLGLKHAPASSEPLSMLTANFERLAAGRQPDQPVDVREAGCQLVGVGVGRRGIVLAHDQAAARRHGDVVGHGGRGQPPRQARQSRVMGLTRVVLSRPAA
jgi:hypothetical protein